MSELASSHVLYEFPVRPWTKMISTSVLEVSVGVYRTLNPKVSPPGNSSSKALR